MWDVPRWTELKLVVVGLCLLICCLLKKAVNILFYSLNFTLKCRDETEDGVDQETDARPWLRGCQRELRCGGISSDLGSKSKKVVEVVSTSGV